MADKGSGRQQSSKEHPRMTTTKTATKIKLPPVAFSEDMDSIVAAGLTAWRSIQATSEELREQWRRVGAALQVGRDLHKSDKAFGQWCAKAGFGTPMARQERSAAMWFAKEGHLLTNDLSQGLSHPIAIQAALRDAKALMVVEAQPVATQALEGLPMPEAAPPAFLAQVELPAPEGLTPGAFRTALYAMDDEELKGLKGYIDGIIAKRGVAVVVEARKAAEKAAAKVKRDARKAAAPPRAPKALPTHEERFLKDLGRAVSASRRGIIPESIAAGVVLHRCLTWLEANAASQLKSARSSGGPYVASCVAQYMAAVRADNGNTNPPGTAPALA